MRCKGAPTAGRESATTRQYTNVAAVAVTACEGAARSSAAAAAAAAGSGVARLAQSSPMEQNRVRSKSQEVSNLYRK